MSCALKTRVPTCLDYPTERLFHLLMWQWLIIKPEMWFKLNRIAFGTVITATAVIIAGRLMCLHQLQRQFILSVKHLMWLHGGEIRITGRLVVIIRSYLRPLVAIAHWHLLRLPVRPLPRPSVPLIPTDLFRLDSWHHSSQFLINLLFFHIFELIIKFLFSFYV